MPLRPKKPAPARSATRNRLSEERIGELLDVAAAAFLEKGFDAASTAIIAERANASKATFYRRFPSKESLFLAVVERHAESVFQAFASTPAHGSLRISLLAFARGLLHVVLSKRHTALVRIVIAETDRHPALAQHFYKTGIARVESMLETFIAQQLQERRLPDHDPATMARQFLNLVTGSPVRWVILGFQAAPLSNAAIETHLEQCLDLFEKAYDLGPEAATMSAPRPPAPRLKPAGARRR